MRSEWRQKGLWEPIYRNPDAPPPNSLGAADMTRTLKITGYMNGHGKAEAFRISELIEKRCAEGKAEKIGRGLYREIKS